MQNQPHRQVSLVGALLPYWQTPVSTLMTVTPSSGFWPGARNIAASLAAVAASCWDISPTAIDCGDLGWATVGLQPLF